MAVLPQPDGAHLGAAPAELLAGTLLMMAAAAIATALLEMLPAPTLHEAEDEPAVLAGTEHEMAAMAAASMPASEDAVSALGPRMMRPLIGMDLLAMRELTAAVLIVEEAMQKYAQDTMPMPPVMGLLQAEGGSQ